MNYRLFLLSFTSLGGLLLGYTTAVIAGTLEPVAQHFSLSTSEQGFFASILLLGALIGSIVSGKIADTLGRKKSIVLSALLFFIGAVLSAIAMVYSTLLLGRFLTGVGVGIVSTANPLFLGEVSSAKRRGIYVSSHQFAITLGILFAYLFGYYFTLEEEWRLMFAIVAIPAFLQLAFSPWIVESPRWLIAQSKLHEAKKILIKLELSEFEQAQMRHEKRLGKKILWKILCIGILLSAFQQLSGINAVIYFAPKIFKEAQFAVGSGAMGATLLVGFVNVIATGVALWLINKVNRRPLMLCTYACMASALLALSSAFFYSTSNIGLIAVISLIAFVVFFAMGPGPLTWVILSEIFPQQIRGLAISGSIFINWGINYLITLFFLDLVKDLGIGGVFAVFTGLCTLATLFIQRTLPETHGKTLEQIEEKFSNTLR